MDSCDVLVVGGGPAGSSCALALRRAGLDVAVMDKRTFPRGKPCAGWITPHVVESLQIDTCDYARGRIFQPISGFRVSVLGRKEIESHYDHPVSYGILRGEFDDYLLRNCGARLRLGEEFRGIAKVGRRWRVNDSIEADLIIGAGGHFCPVARHLGAKTGPEIVMAAQELEFEMTQAQLSDCKVRGEVPELFCSPDFMGYAWCFRKGNYLNIGIGREDSKGLSAYARDFLDVLKAGGRVPADTPAKFRGHAYILYGHTRRELLGDGMILIGDAAGLAYVESGEGIRTAVESAFLAAETIRAAGGDFTRSKLEPYEKRLRSRFGKGAPFRKIEGLTASILRSLVGTKWFTRHVVLEMFLHTRQPVLTLN